MINSDSGKTKGTATGSARASELITTTHNIMKQGYSYRAAYKAAKSIKGAARHLSIGTDQVVKFLIRGNNGTQTVKGRFPDCIKGVSSIAGDCNGSVISVREVNHDPARGCEQKFFYSHL